MDAESAVELGESLEGIDEHAGLGFEGKRHARLLGVVEQRARAPARAASIPVSSSIESGALPDQSETDSAWSNLARSMDRRRKSRRTAATRGIGIHQGGVVFHPRVEQIARAGLDDPGHAVAIEGRRDRTHLAAEYRWFLVRVESAGVEGDRNALYP